MFEKPDTHRCCGSTHRLRGSRFNGPAGEQPGACFALFYRLGLWSEPGRRAHAARVPL